MVAFMVGELFVQNFYSIFSALNYYREHWKRNKYEVKNPLRWVGCINITAILKRPNPNMHAQCETRK